MNKIININNFETILISYLLTQKLPWSKRFPKTTNINQKKRSLIYQGNDWCWIKLLLSLLLLTQLPVECVNCSSTWGITSSLTDDLREGVVVVILAFLTFSANRLTNSSGLKPVRSVTMASNSGLLCSFYAHKKETEYTKNKSII